MIWRPERRLVPEQELELAAELLSEALTEDGYRWNLIGIRRSA